MASYDQPNPQSFGWFWNEGFWLPNNVTWRELQDTENRIYGQSKDFFVVGPLTVVLMLCRVLVEHIGKKIGKLLSISETCYKRPPANAKLEKAVANLPKRPTNDDILKICKQTDLHMRAVERWIRQMRKSERPSEMKKFRETFWRFIFYSSSSILGIWIVHDKKYLWSAAWFFLNYPEDHQIDLPRYVYYMIELAFYCSLMISQFSDVKRKDFVEMFIHHIATIMLISGSYITNMTKIGAIIMLVHDVSDVFLEFAKLAKYAKLVKTTTVGFALLAISFITTRMVIFPAYVIRGVIFEGMVILKPFCGFLIVLTGFLLVLQILHLYWFTHLIRTAYALLVGKVQKDTRSESESSMIEENGISCDGDH